MSQEENPKEVKWLECAEDNKKYKTTTWYRCVLIEGFVNEVEEESKIVGIIFDGNKIGFVLDDK
jgi:hypothetical protein